MEVQTCKGCGAELPIEAFCPSCRGRKGQSCRACMAARSRARNKADPEHRAKNAARLKAWGEKNPDKIKAAKRAHYERNKETMDRRAVEWTRAHPEEHRAAIRRWHKENRVRSYAHTRTRNLRKRGQTPPDADFDAIARFYEEAARLIRETGIPHEVDHVIPLSRGGLHHQDNLRVITRAENLAKGNKLPSESAA